MRPTSSCGSSPRPSALDEASLAAARAAWGPLAFDAAGAGPSDLVASATPITAGGVPEAFAIVRRLYKLGLLLSKLAVPAEIRPWLVRRAGALLNLDPAGLPGAAGDAPASFAGYESVAAAVRLLATAKADPEAVSDLFELAGSAAFTRDDWVDATARLYRQEAATIHGLTDVLNISPASAQSPQFYLDFAGRLALWQHVGVDAATLASGRSRSARTTPTGAGSATSPKTARGRSSSPSRGPSRTTAG